MVVQDHSGSVVELVLDGEQVRLGVHAQVGSLREVVAQEAVGVLVRPALPRGVGVTEVDRCPQGPRGCVNLLWPRDDGLIWPRLRRSIVW